MNYVETWDFLMFSCSILFNFHVLTIYNCEYKLITQLSFVMLCDESSLIQFIIEMQTWNIVKII